MRVLRYLFNANSGRWGSFQGASSVEPEFAGQISGPSESSSFDVSGITRYFCVLPLLSGVKVSDELHLVAGPRMERSPLRFHVNDPDAVSYSGSAIFDLTVLEEAWQTSPNRRR